MDITELSSLERFMYLTDKTIRELEEEINLLKKDKNRMDWLETQDCWIGIKGEYEAEPIDTCGGLYTDKVRDICDYHLANKS